LIFYSASAHIYGHLVTLNFIGESKISTKDTHLTNVVVNLIEKRSAAAVPVTKSVVKATPKAETAKKTAKPVIKATTKKAT
tara:strand:+ start:699 stop:941 length:243 start_codon:yes stop_codon:yes gene_type:complete